MEPITSRTNPKIKQARALRQRKERDATGLFLVEGITHVAAAVESGAAVECIFYVPEQLASAFGSDLIARAEANSIACLPASLEAFSSLSEKENPAGIAAMVRRNQLRLQSFNAESFPLIVALVAPQDPGNIGTILRTMDAASASGLILLEGGADAFHPNAVRASMGAVFYKPVVSAEFTEFAEWAKSNGYRIVGASARAAADYRAAEFRRPLILLLGSEQKGLSPEQRSVCDEMIRLPMEGKISSLNLAVAAGILLYEILSRRNKI
ncbi:MAG: RNA methyltransferase [Chloroflexi bacterium]|nr:RNA methyltransferase [Chloroflexota bacterium]